MGARSGTTIRELQKYEARGASSPSNPPPLNDDGLPIAPMTWAERLRRVFDVDITIWAECEGRQCAYARAAFGGHPQKSQNRG